MCTSIMLLVQTHNEQHEKIKNMYVDMPVINQLSENNKEKSFMFGKSFCGNGDMFRYLYLIIDAFTS